MTRKVRDNGAEACIHFQKAETIAFFHNSREAFLPETSNEELRAKNECDKTAEEARELFEKLSAQGDENFLKNCGRRTNMKAENKLWESALNLRERHTMADVQRVNKKIQEITGFIPIQTAIHRDEGHVDEKTGDFIQNVHAQTTWLTQDPETGKSMAYLLFGQKDVYRKIQDIVAEELGMERGQSAEITGAKHFKNMRDYKQMKRSEAKINKEWEQKLEKNNAEWQEKLAQRQAEWEAKQAAREARQAEWESKIPEIIAARERRSKFICEKLDWEDARTGKMLAREMEILGMNFAGVNNPNGNILLEAQKHAIRNIFYMLGTTAQLAVFLMKKTLQNDEKLAADAKIYNVEATLLRAVDYIANSDKANGEELKKLIQRKFLLIPEEKREELFQYALENAPTEELKADIKALVEGRFEDIAKSAAAQKRIENRDLRQELKEYSEELKRIREELKAMDEENRILVAAERAILKEKGAGRAEYADQEAENRERVDELKTLRQQVKDLNNDILKAKKQSELNAKTIAKQAEKIAKLTAQIAEITKENAEKQKELEAEKAKRLITPQQLDRAEQRISELEDKIKEQEFIFYGKADEIEAAEFEKEIEKQIITPQMPPKGAFDIIDELEEQLKEQKLKQREEPKIEPKPEPVKPEPIKKSDDFTNIYGYSTPKPEPRRRFGDDYEHERKTYDRPRYEPKPEKIEPREPEHEKIEPFRDPWKEIESDLERWKKADSEVDKKMLSLQILQNIEKYEKSGWDIPIHRRLTMDSYRRRFEYDPADAIEREREERKRQAERETSVKYDDVKTKNVKQEAEATQRAIKKKKDELEFG